MSLSHARTELMRIYGEAFKRALPRTPSKLVFNFITVWLHHAPHMADILMYVTDEIERLDNILLHQRNSLDYWIAHDTAMASSIWQEINYYEEQVNLYLRFSSQLQVAMQDERGATGEMLRLTKEHFDGGFS